MAFAGTNCQTPADELALINWRATRLAGALGALDFPGPIPRNGDVGSGDALIRTIRLVAAALSGMTRAAYCSADPLRAPGDAAGSGRLLARAMTHGPWRRPPRTSAATAPRSATWSAAK